MMNAKIMGVLALLLIIVLCGITTAADVTTVFQQSDTYTGVQDTYISVFSPNANFKDGVSVSTDRQKRNEMLVKFELNSIPNNSQVKKAELVISCTSAGNGADRIIRIYQVLVPWDHGTATYNTPWSKSGGDQGVDYSDEIDNIIVATVGPYTIDVTPQVVEFVKSSNVNNGFILIDTGGYKGGSDIRGFASSENVSVVLRPQLTVTYNPNAPLVDAGNDYEDLEFALGSVLTLGGLNSPDFEYSWRFTKKAYGSKLADDALAGVPNPKFQPDVNGHYIIEATATNKDGDISTDSVALFVLSIDNSHPRLGMNYEQINKLKKAKDNLYDVWISFNKYLKTPSYWYGDTVIEALAVGTLVTGDSSYGTESIARAQQIVDAGDITNLDKIINVVSVATAYDWNYALLTSERKTLWVNWMNKQLDTFRDSYGGAFHNYSIVIPLAQACVGYGTYGDNYRAAEWIKEARWERFEKMLLPGLDIFGEGGGWPEGNGYGSNTTRRYARFCRYIKSASGENLFLSNPFFKDYMNYAMHMNWPGTTEYYGQPSRLYEKIGDGLRGFTSHVGYAREAQLLLADEFENTVEAQNTYWFVGKTEPWRTWMIPWDYFWFNPNITSTEPTDVSWFAKGMGTVFTRSDWSESASWAAFICSDHFEFHQHLDANTFVIYANGKNLVSETGNYDGTGVSEHARDWHKQTIAHNGMLIYNPDEVFPSLAQGEPGRNSGGQRTMSPVSIVAGNAQNWYDNADAYDTGDVVSYINGNTMTYVMGDATNAYSNPRYDNEGQNVPKIDNFTRQFLHIRPNIFIVYDRVNALDASFKKYWLLHFLGEPIVSGTATNVSLNEDIYDGKETVYTDGDSVLTVHTVLPVNSQIRKLGGRDIKDFWSFGVNVNAYDPKYGEWRIQVEPTVEQKSDNFLNVLYTDNSAVKHSTVSISSENMSGVIIDDKIIALFANEEKLEIRTTVDIDVPKANTYWLYVADLDDGIYNVYRNGAIAFNMAIYDGFLETPILLEKGLTSLMVARTDVAPVKPPDISNLKVDHIEQTAAIVSWYTSQVPLANGKVEYGVTDALGLEKIDDTYTSIHHIGLYELTPDTVYYYRVIAKSLEGGITTTEIDTFKTLAVVAPPVRPPDWGEPLPQGWFEIIMDIRRYDEKKTKMYLRGPIDAWE